MPSEDYELLKRTVGELCWEKGEYFADSFISSTVLENLYEFPSKGAEKI
jgi:hypothetical protein